MNKAPLKIKRDALISKILEIPTLQERGFTEFDLVGHTNIELLRLYENNEPNPTNYQVITEPWVPVKQEEAWGYV